MRKACKLDPEVKAISKDAVPLITKAVELFVGFLARKVAYTVSLRGVRSIREADLIQTIYMHESLEFMRIDFPRKPLTSVPRGPSVRQDTVPKHRVHVSQKTIESTVGVKAKADRLAVQPVPAGKSIAQFFGGGASSTVAAASAVVIDKEADKEVAVVDAAAPVEESEPVEAAVEDAAGSDAEE